MRLPEGTEGKAFKHKLFFAHSSTATDVLLQCILDRIDDLQTQIIFWPLLYRDRCLVAIYFRDKMVWDYNILSEAFFFSKPA